MRRDCGQNARATQPVGLGLEYSPTRSPAALTPKSEPTGPETAPTAHTEAAAGPTTNLRPPGRKPHPTLTLRPVAAPTTNLRAPGRKPHPTLTLRPRRAPGDKSERTGPETAASAQSSGGQVDDTASEVMTVSNQAAIRAAKAEVEYCSSTRWRGLSQWQWCNSILRSITIPASPNYCVGTVDLLPWAAFAPADD